jgi:hypothetical protein
MLDRRRAPAVLVVLTALFALAPERALATQKFGPLQLSGNVQSQNLVRMPDGSHYQFVQNRNTAHIRLDYDWLQAGRLYNRYDIPFVESSHLFVLWRGVYDSIYDTTPGIIAKEDIHGRAYALGTQNLYEFARSKGLPRRAITISGLSNGERDALKFDNQLREAYADVKFRNIPLTVRAGRQQIVWGETDNFRMLDRANALDLTWHLQQEVPAPAFGWDEIRRPYWMIKFLYDLGDVWKFNQSFLEWYWNPGDWEPAKQSFLPRPWGLPFLNPLTNPVDGAFIEGVCHQSPVTNNKGQHVCTSLIGGTKLFEHGDYSRNPLENSQVGVRYHGIAPNGIEFTLNYFYQRWAGDDGTNYAPLKGVLRTFNPKIDQQLADKYFKKGTFAAEYYTPYIHTVGASANYSDETHTQAVFRAETIYDFGIPFFDVSKVTIVDNPVLPGITRKNMWKGMIAFDRPTWIRSVNKKSTVFLTGQFFWHYLVNNTNCDPATVALLPPQQRPKAGSCLTGGLDLPSQERSAPPNAFRDKLRDWETLATFAAFTTNQFNMEPFWTIDFIARDDFAINLAQRYFVTPRGVHSPIFETWGVAGLNRGRSETSLRLSYQF